MKFQSMPVKRRSKKKGAFRTLFANVANKRRRQRASTAAMPAGDLDGDVPNLGVARALVVILVIHVVAIAGIFFHSHWLDGESENEVVAANKAVPLLVTGSVSADESLPKIQPEDKFYTVGTGDTWDVIARRLGVDEGDLREDNGDVENISPGMYLRIPPKKIVALESAEIANVRQSSGGSVMETIPAGDSGPAMVTTEAALRADAVPESSSTAPASVSSGVKATHVVKSGDTLWSISKKYGSSVEAVSKANGIDNARHLKIGMSLTIPR